MKTAYVKLGSSIVFNFLAKVPGIIGILFVLPRLRAGLGINNYAEVLVAFSIGALVTLPFGGLGSTARREIAKAHAKLSGAAEADQFSGTWITAAALLLLAVIASFAWNSFAPRSAGWIIFVVSLFPIISAFLNISDNIRAAYNEHFVTAGLQFVWQSAIYGWVYLFRVTPHSMVLAAAILQGPFIISSMIGLIILLIQRPYLISWKKADIVPLLRAGSFALGADASLFAILNFLTVFLFSIFGASQAAWYGTLSRLFQSVLSPLLLFLFPLTGYLSMSWLEMHPARKRIVSLSFLFGGLAYGVAVFILVMLFAPYALNHEYHLTYFPTFLDLLCVGLFYGAIVAQKSYALFVFSIHDGRSLAAGTVSAVILSAVVAGVLFIWLGPLSALNGLFVLTGFGLLLVIIRDSSKRFTYAPSFEDLSTASDLKE